jgi:hypothetical protein
MVERRNGFLAAAATILQDNNKTPEEAIKALVWTRRSGKHHRFWIHCLNSMAGKTEAYSSVRQARQRDVVHMARAEERRHRTEAGRHLHHGSFARKWIRLRTRRRDLALTR